MPVIDTVVIGRYWAGNSAWFAGFSINRATPLCRLGTASTNPDRCSHDKSKRSDCSKGFFGDKHDPTNRAIPSLTTYHERVQGDTWRGGISGSHGQ
jgi:hypothetical protein